MPVSQMSATLAQINNGIEGHQSATGQSRPLHADTRPTDQNAWTESDVDSLWRDRYEAEQVRLLYIISNPEEFPAIFADDIGEGEPRITPANLAAGGTPDPPQPGLDSHLQEEVRDSAWHAEVIEMHQTQDFSIDRPQPPPPQPDYDGASEQGDTEMETLTRHDFYFPSHDGRPCSWEGVEPWRDDISDAEDEIDPRPNIDWSPYRSLTEMLLVQVRADADQLDEDERRHFMLGVLDSIEASSRLFLPRWQDDALIRLATAIGETERDRREDMQRAEQEALEQQRRDAAWDQADELRRRWRASRAEYEQLGVEYRRLEAEFAAGSKGVEYQQWKVVADHARSINKSRARTFDMLTWYPWLPDNFRDCLERFANYHRKVARWNLAIKLCEARYHERAIDPNPFNENDWAAISGEPFGYEYPADMVGGFSYFVAPDPSITIPAALKLIEAHGTMRCCRMLLAYERLTQGPTVAHESDHRIPQQFMSWLGHARFYLGFLRDEDPRAVDIAPQLKDAIDGVISFFNTIEGLLQQNWQALNLTDSVAVRGLLFEMLGGELADGTVQQVSAEEAGDHYERNGSAMQITAEEAEAAQREQAARRQAERERREREELSRDD